MSIVCSGCGLVFEAKRATARYCSDRCKKRVQRGQGPPAEEPAAPVSPRQASGPVIGQVAVRVIADLTKAGRLDTPMGALAVQLAGRVESPYETGAAVAALSRELSRVLDLALEGANKETDLLDELKERRDRTRGAAG